MANLTVKGIAALIKQIDAGYQPKFNPACGQFEFYVRDNPASPARVFDGDGLLLIHKPGTNSTGWRFRYQWAGSKKEISLGPLSKVGLGKARLLRRDAEQQLIDGNDPSDERKKTLKAEKAKRDADKLTFTALVWQWSDNYHSKENLADTTKVRNTRILKYLEADLGSSPVAMLSRKAVLKSLQRIASDNGNESAHRALSLCHLFCEHLVIHELRDGDPTVGIRNELGKVVDKPRSAIIDPVEFGGLLRSIWNYPGHAATIAAMKLLPHVFLRPGELRKARWDEINFDAQEWIIPKSRMKTRRTHPVDHLVPMSKQVTKILEDLKALNLDDELVFPSLRKGRPLSENAFRVALLNLGIAGDVHHPHGFRKSASSLLAKLKFDQRWIDKQLAHAVKGVSGKYQLYDFGPERKKMMQSWSNYLDQLRKGASVTAIGKGVA